MANTGRLAEIIKQRRAVLGISQTDIANKVGVTRQSISLWEQAKVDESIRASHLAALEKALELKPGDLLKVYYDDMQNKTEAELVTK